MAELNRYSQRLSLLENKVKQLRVDVNQIIQHTLPAVSGKLSQQSRLDKAETVTMGAVNYIFLLHVPTGGNIKQRVSYRQGVRGSINSAGLLEELRQIARMIDPINTKFKFVDADDTSFYYEDFAVAVESVGYVMMAVVTPGPAEYHLRQRMLQYLNEINLLYRLALVDYDVQTKRLPMIERYLDELMI
ncbi:MAG: hypothetical protein WCL57_05090 [Chloroflexota bacterium]|jgi:hypothetical protein|nr:hypothetical protein [Chloroflexota bacterium]